MDISIYIKIFDHFIKKTKMSKNIPEDLLSQMMHVPLFKCPLYAAEDYSIADRAGAYNSLLEPTGDDPRPDSYYLREMVNMSQVRKDFNRGITNPTDLVCHNIRPQFNDDYYWDQQSRNYFKKWTR